jgi:hypothetical protein
MRRSAVPDNSAATNTIRTAAPRLTPSSVNDLLCPAKYKLLRIDRVWKKRDPLIPVAHGKSVHQLLNLVYSARVNGEVDLSNLEAQARGAVMGNTYPRSIDVEEQVGRVMAAVRGFVAADDYEDIQGILPGGLEKGGEFPLLMENGRVLCILSAVLDCLLVRQSQGEKLIIRERKTTAQRIDLKECYIQMRIAKKMYPQYRDIAIEFDWLDEDNRVIRDTVTARMVRGQHQIVLGMAYKVLTATDFPAVPGETQCRYCSEREKCQQLPADEISEAALRLMAERLS